MLQIDLTQAQQIHSRDPGAVQQMIDALVGGLMQDVATPLLNAGEGIWEGLAAIVIVWTGLRIAFSGAGISAWDIVRLVTAIAIPRTLLFFYSNPMPIGGETFPGLLVGMGAWVADMVLQDTWSSSWEWLGSVIARVWAEFQAAAGALGALQLLNFASHWTEAWAGVQLALVSLVMGTLGLLLLVIGYAQVIWASFAIGIATVVGPIFIPFLLFEPLAFLFWGWFRTMLVYSLYSMVAACVVRIFFAAIRAATDGIWAHLTPSLADMGSALMWIVSYAVIAVAGILAAFKIPELAASLVSGNVGGGGMLGAILTVGGAAKAGIAAARGGLRGAPAK